MRLSAIRSRRSIGLNHNDFGGLSCFSDRIGVGTLSFCSSIFQEREPFDHGMMNSPPGIC
jgi:hypothetical protein